MVQTLTFPSAPVLGQIINIRCGKSGGSITLPMVGSNVFYVSNISLSATSVTTLVLPNVSTSSWLYYDTNKWIQMSDSLYPLIDTTAGTTGLSIGSTLVNGNIVIGAALGQGDISIAAAQTANGTVTIGSSVSTTTINSNLSLASNKTVFTTSGQQLRLGYATTQTSATVTSSYGPYIKSFGPALSNALEYVILYEGDNGLFPTGSDGCGGLLTIFLKNNITQSKFATYVYTIAKRVGIITFTGMQAISLNAQGWTSTPGVSAPSVSDNNIRITFNGGDYINTTVSWTFIGSI